MIRITRPRPAPEILETKGRILAQRDCQSFEDDPQVFMEGVKSLEFDAAVYGHETVKASLRRMQHNKCCFCESTISHVSYGDVEHFRPKAGARQIAGGKLYKPGYYWLTYSWENLLFACQICNQSFKKNLFPLTNENMRARSHLNDISLEEPLLIDPSRVDPALFISFREEVPFALAGNQPGSTTIEILGLGRAALSEIRRDRLEQLRLLLAIARMGAVMPESADARAFLNRAREDHAEFSAMARANLKEWGGY